MMNASLWWPSQGDGHVQGADRQVLLHPDGCSPYLSDRKRHLQLEVRKRTRGRPAWPYYWAGTRTWPWWLIFHQRYGLCPRQRERLRSMGQSWRRGRSFNDCMPFFKKMERFDAGRDSMHGGNGPLSVTRSAAKHAFYDAFQLAGEQYYLSAAGDYTAARRKVCMSPKPSFRAASVAQTPRPICARRWRGPT